MHAYWILQIYLRGKKFFVPEWEKCLSTQIITNNSRFHWKRRKNYKLLQNNLARYKNIFQYVYSNVYSEVFYATEKRGFNLKSNFHIMFKTYRDKMQIRSMGKNPSNYESVQKETNTHKQKPINIDDFNDLGEAKVKERVNKRKTKRCWKQ